MSASATSTVVLRHIRPASKAARTCKTLYEPDLRHEEPYMGVQHINHERRQKLAYHFVEGRPEIGGHRTMIWCGVAGSPTWTAPKAVFLHEQCEPVPDGLLWRFELFWANGSATVGVQPTDGFLSALGVRTCPPMIASFGHNGVVLHRRPNGWLTSFLARWTRPDAVNRPRLINPAPDFHRRKIGSGPDGTNQSAPNVIEDGVVYEPSIRRALC